jgi:hypothetical protein
MPSSPFSKNCKPPKPPILAWLSGGLSVKKLDYKYEVTNMKNGGGGDFKICFTTCTKVSAIFCHKKKTKKSIEWNWAVQGRKKNYNPVFLNTYARSTRKGKTNAMAAE